MVNKIYLKQIYCSYSRTHNIQNGFPHFLLLFLRSTLLLKINKHIGEELFVFYKFAFPSTLLMSRCPTAASAVTCVSRYSTYKLSISADMIVEIQVTKLLTNFLQRVTGIRFYLGI